MRITKRDLILSLHAADRTVPEIARALECSPVYVQNVIAVGVGPQPPDPLDTVTKQMDALLAACKAVVEWAHTDGPAPGGGLEILFEDVIPQVDAAIALCQPDPSSYETPSEVAP